MKRSRYTFFSVFLILTVFGLLLPGCTGVEVSRAARELGEHQDKVEYVEGAVLAAEQALAMVGLSDEDRARVESVLRGLESSLAELRQRTPELVERLERAQTVEDRTAGNALIAVGEIAGTFGGAVPGPIGALILGLGTLAGGLGTMLNRRHTARVVASIEAAKRLSADGTGVVDFRNPDTEGVIRAAQGASTTRLVKRLRAAA